MDPSASKSKTTSEAQVRFLVSCIKYSNAGKINWDEVTAECGIVTKAAAIKRYERLLKSFGLSPNGQPLNADVCALKTTTNTTNPSDKVNKSNTGTSKKRIKTEEKNDESASKKFKAYDEEDDMGDDF